MNIDLNNVILETACLRLVPITQKYADDVFQEFTSEVTVWMWPSVPKSVTDTEKFIMESTLKRVAGNEIVFAILDKDSEEFLGCAGIHEIDTKTPELGLWLKISAQNQGYGKEVVQALKNWTDENVEYEYIKYPVATENARSRALAESLGGVAGEEFEKPTEDGRALREVEYRIYKK